VTNSGSSSVVHHVPLPYRADIDGLRAIAVSAVVLFHAGLSELSGGFVGVDVFFVISGYLIGGQIFREVSAGTFSFKSFYSRRVRRLLPAFFALLVVFSLFGTFALTPQEMRTFGRESTAAVFGGSNFLFYTAGDYFAPAADRSPLLMTWSLGVEEQFYLIFPFIALGVSLFKRHRLLTVGLLCVLSFAGSLVLIKTAPAAAFYLLPTRAWELGAGTILALKDRAHRPAHGLSKAQEVISTAGFALIIGSMAFYRPEWAFPGAFATLPVLGTVMLIATPSSWLNQRLLAPAPLRFIGLVSYSWYLWHWPIFYVYRVIADYRGGMWSVLPFALSFAAAVLSWRFVERPFRARVLGESTVLVRYGIATCVISAMALFWYVSDGWPSRLAPEADRLARVAIKARRAPCLVRSGVAVLSDSNEHCMPLVQPEQNGRIVVIGDSHADALAPGVAAYAERIGSAFGQLTKSSCPALWGYAAKVAGNVDSWRDCLRYQERAFAAVAEDPDVKLVFLASYWSSQMHDLRSEQHSAPTSFEVALTDTAARLTAAGKRVVSIQDVPTFRIDPYARAVGSHIPLRRALAKLLGGSEEFHIAVPSDVIPDASRVTLTALTRNLKKVHVIDPWARLCSRKGCRFATNKDIFYTDFQHITASGARLIFADPYAAGTGMPE
jgi:peptidoglycan/LPS O-acetylase OafA/YrhL